MNSQVTGRRDGSERQGGGTASFGFTEHLRNRIPVDPLPALRQGIGLQFQSSAGANTEVVRQLARLRKLGRAERFVFVRAVATSLVLNTEWDVADDAPFKLDLPDIGIRFRADKVADRVADGSQCLDFIRIRNG